MALVTRCSNPACLTLFRVTPAQLQAFGGQVRCSSCKTVFDAFPSLTTVADSALKAPERAVPAPPSTPAPTLTPAQPEVQAGLAPGPEAPSARGFGAGEKVLEWETPAVQPRVDARTEPPSMPVDRVPDQPPGGSLDFVVAPSPLPAGAREGERLSDAVQEYRVPADAGAALTGGRSRDARTAKPPVRPESDAAAVSSGASPPPSPVVPPAASRAASPAAPARVAAPSQRVDPHPDPVPQIAPELTDYSVKPGPPPRAASPDGRTRLVPMFGGLLLVAAAGALLLAGDRLPAPLATALRENALAAAVGMVALLCWVLRRFHATWIAAAVVLTLLLASQLVFAYRTQVAALYPASRPLLERLCRMASCEVGLPKAADQLVIESSDLQAVDAAKPNLIRLVASVRNRAAIEVAFPAIEVTLTDAQDRPMARRVLLPEQYLAGRQPARAGLRAGEDFSIRLTLDTTELRPVGYRLYLFYP